MTKPATILVDVDTQRDFVRPNGALYVPAHDAVLERIEAHLASDDYAAIVGSVDSHAHDAWEFAAHGGPFPPHCVKGTPGWLRAWHASPERTRFVPMQTVDASVRNLVGENAEGAGSRELSADHLAAEALDGVGLYFEKEVYSLFANPAAAPVLRALVDRLGGSEAVRFDVIGYCTGGYCVDAAALGLARQGYPVRVLADATAAIGGAEGAQASQQTLEAAGVAWVGTP